MSNGTTVVSRVMGQASGLARRTYRALRQNAVSVIFGFNINPFTWHIAGDLGHNKEDGAREVYFSWLPLTMLLGIYRRSK